MSDQLPIQNPKSAIQNSVVLACTHHDPSDAMLAQAQRVWPLLRDVYAAIVVLASPSTGERTAQWLRDQGARLGRQDRPSDLDQLGLVRLDTLRLADGAGHVHLCDWDRVLHWAEAYPDELREVVAAIPDHDLLILGRTPRAFGTHPRVQRDTEAIVNHAFGLAWGQELDVTAASRGLSRRAIDALLSLPTPEATIGNDCAWPLHLARVPNLVIGYAQTDGLEWETPDRHGDEIATVGGLDTWIAAYDADPERWAFRLRLAMLEVEAVQRWR